MTNQQKIDAILELAKGLDYGDCVDVLCHFHRRVDELWGDERWKRMRQAKQEHQDALNKAMQAQIRELQKP